MILIQPGLGRILDANITACSFYGYKTEELEKLYINGINNLTKIQAHQYMLKAKNEAGKYFHF